MTRRTFNTALPHFMGIHARREAEGDRLRTMRSVRLSFSREVSAAAMCFRTSADVAPTVTPPTRSMHGLGAHTTCPAGHSKPAALRGGCGKTASWCASRTEGTWVERHRGEAPP